MAFGAGGGSPDEVKGDINVTPLVDVCLVLLIIFMVVTPMLQQGVDVQLPQGPHAEKKPGQEGDLIVSIKQDGTVFVGDDWIPDRNLVTYLRAESVSLADVSFGAVVARAPTLGLSSQRPPAVVFTLPVQGDRLTPTAPIVVQFNKHMDEMSFAGRVRLRYADENDALTGLRLLYEDTNRALVVDPGEPLASGRELVLELLEGIVDVDGQALTPGATPAAAGVVETVRYRVGS